MNTDKKNKKEKRKVLVRRLFATLMVLGMMITSLFAVYQGYQQYQYGEEVKAQQEEMKQEEIKDEASDEIEKEEGSDKNTDTLEEEDKE